MKDYDSKQDRRFREALEKRSIDEGRADVAGSLNRLAIQDGIQKSAVDVLTSLRAAAQGRQRTVGDMNARHDAGLAKAAATAFNRLHPLDRAAASFKPQPKQAPDTEGNDAAKDERYVSPLRAGRVRDADGSMRGGDRDYWDGQGVKELSLADMKEKLILSLEQMRALSFAKLASSRYW